MTDRVKAFCIDINCEVSQFFSGLKPAKGVIMPRTRGPR